MPTPDPIGRIRYTEPRAVYVRESNDVINIHSAVHGTVAVYTDTYTQAQALVGRWPELMTVINDKVAEILSDSE